MNFSGVATLLDADVAELCALPDSYWQTALHTIYEKSVTESAHRTARPTG